MNKETSAIFKCLSAIIEEWQLTPRELGTVLNYGKDFHLNELAVEHLLTNPVLRVETSHLVAVYMLLCQEFSMAEDRRSWVRSMHFEFNESPLDVMLDSSGLVTIRAYLESRYP